MVNMINEMEKRMKKASVTSKTNRKIKADVKDKDRAAHKMRKEIIELKHQNTAMNMDI